MPLHLPAVSRRTFLASTLAAGALSSVGNAADEKAADPNLFALLSDTHIPKTQDIILHDVNMTDHLRQVVGEIGKLSQRPAAAIVNGDCAQYVGLKEDYENFTACLKPLVEAGVPLHMTMGNHDNRDTFYKVLTEQRPEKAAVMSKHVSVIESEHANWFLLDSLMKVDVATGELGEEQLRWLAEALDARKDKPALVMAHHNLQFMPPAEGKAWGGVRDTESLMKLLNDRPHVHAYLYGHTHVWQNEQRGHVKLINLPPVAYVFAKGKPSGWVEARLSKTGVKLQLKALDARHPQADETVEVIWRA